MEIEIIDDLSRIRDEVARHPEIELEYRKTACDHLLMAMQYIENGLIRQKEKIDA